MGRAFLRSRMGSRFFRVLEGTLKRNPHMGSLKGSFKDPERATKIVEHYRTLYTLL